jgi:hypothetical protein
VVVHQLRVALMIIELNQARRKGKFASFHMMAFRRLSTK